MFHAHLEQFQGPLDVLLQLIEKEDLDISRVSLANVTEEYLAYVEKLDASRTAEIADFLVIAARLVYLKSKLLVPEELDEEEGIALEDQLRLYKRFVDAAKELEARYAQATPAFFRETSPFTGEFVEPRGVTGGLLEQVMQQIVGAHSKRRAIVERVEMANIISIEESIARIRVMLDTGKRFAFSHLIRRNADRAERIVHFLALLELVKQRQVHVTQRSLFDEIHIAAV